MDEQDARAAQQDWLQKHMQSYLRTDGAEGHFLDMSGVGGLPQTPTLLLRTKGRRSGNPRVTPLIYGRHGEDYVIIASNGGAPNHPAWFLNLSADPEVRFQVGSDKFRGRARVADASERQALWAEMAKIYPPYDEYQQKAGREIPVVLLHPEEKLGSGPATRLDAA